MTTQHEAAGRTWFTCKKKDDDEAEVSIYDEIGFWGVTAKTFRDELKALGPVNAIRLSINSPGGEVFAGLAIHNMLKRHKAKVHVTIDGIAASIASVIAMAGDTIVMPANAMMMIHDPSGVVIGTSKDMRSLADALDKIKTGLVTAYVEKTKKEPDEIEELMTAETWLTAEEAVEEGFADKIEKAVKVAASFDLSKFRNAPTAAAAERKDVAGDVSGDEDEHRETKESTMTDAEKLAAAEKEIADLKAKFETLTASTGDAGKAATEAERKRAADITAACALAKAPDKAAAFIAEGKSLSEIVNVLQNARADASDSQQTNARHAQAEAANDAAPAAWDKQIERVNARFK